MSVLAGLLLDVSIAASFGAGAASDSFFVGARIPLLLAVMVMVGANQALVPAFSTWLTKKGEEESWHLISLVLTATLIGGFLVVLVAAAVAAPLMTITAPGLSDAAIREAASVARTMFLVVPLISAAEVMRALLNARHSFVIPAAMNVVLNGLAATIVFASGGARVQIIAWAYVAGATAQLLFMLGAAHHRGFRYRATLDFANPDVRAAGRLCTRPLLAAALNPTARLGEQLFLSFLPSGSITIVNYGYRLVSAIGGAVFFRSVIVALVPRLTEATVRGDREELITTTRVGLRLMLALSIPLTAFMAILAEPTALAIFWRGDFSRHDATLLGVVLALYAASLVGSAVQRGLLAPFFSGLDTKVPLRNTLYGVAANLALLFPLFLLFGSDDPNAVLVVPIAYSVAQYVNMGHAWYRVRALVPGPFRGSGWIVSRLVGASAVAAGAMLIAYALLDLGSVHARLREVTGTVGAAALGLATLGVALKLLGVGRPGGPTALGDDDMGPPRPTSRDAQVAAPSSETMPLNPATRPAPAVHPDGCREKEGDLQSRRVSDMTRSDPTVHEQVIADVERELLQLFQGRGLVRVLDAGCGARSKMTFPGQWQVTGIDTSEKQLNRNEKLDHKIVGDIQTYDFEPGSFEVVTFWNVLEHLADPTTALDRVLAALAPGGVLVLASPNIWSIRTMITRITPHRFHVWFYRHILDKPDAGTDDVAPFPTVLSGEMSPTGIRRYATKNQLEVLSFVTYEPNQTLKVRKRSRALGTLLDAAGGASRVVTRGRVDLRQSEYVAVLRKPDGA